MNPQPCSVCGGTETNLMDGFYYCAECGTQDVNAQETIVELTILADGTTAISSKKKITTVLNNAIEMSGEWHKWHTVNFILLGLVEELMTLGASTGFKEKVLWIWSRYMKEFMNKDEMGAKQEKEKQIENSSMPFLYEDEIENSIIEPEENDKSIIEPGENDEKTVPTFKRRRPAMKFQTKLRWKQRARTKISVINTDVLVAILYLGLNLDKSDIQLSHLLRFMKEGRLSIKNWKKFVPKELDQKSIPEWRLFTVYRVNTNPRDIRYLALSLVKVLKLSPPIMPDLKKIADNFVKELCLPKVFKNLVYSLMHFFPCDYLNISFRFITEALIRVPDYEIVVMCYIIVALKMCFGLDDYYEIKLSDAVDKINREENRLKSYKLSMYSDATDRLGMYSDATDRLFSFREWANFLQYRKTMLCKHFLPLARQHNLDIDDVVFMEQVEAREKSKPNLSDDVTMDILNKIQDFELGSFIPKTEFVATLTSLTSYTEVILQYIQDPDIKLLLSEDFSQYSLTYACENLKLLVDGVNIVTGVNEENKTFSEEIIGNLVAKQIDTSMVYVRNCDNRNWLKTNPPDVEHVFKIEKSDDDCDSDHGYDSNIENTLEKNKITDKTVENPEETRELETIEEEKEGVFIFDDENIFDDVFDGEEKPVKIDHEIDSFVVNDYAGGDFDSKIDDNDTVNHAGGDFDSKIDDNDTVNHAGGDFDSKIDDNDTVNTEVIFDPKTFDRENTIKELVLAACEKYKIPIPKEYNPREPVKRKNIHINNETGEIVKRRKRVNTKRGEAQKMQEDIINAYYMNMENDLLNKVSEHLKFVMGDSIDVDANYEANNNNGDPIAENNDSITPTILEDKSKTLEDTELAVLTENSHIILDEETNIDDLIPKTNPKFDEKTHDIKQLYVKYSQKLQFEDILEVEDPNIESILQQKIEECGQNALKTCAKDLRQEKEDSNGSDEEMPSEDDDDVTDMEYVQKKDIKMEPLIQNVENEFKYWFRLYTTPVMRKCPDRPVGFIQELNENFPKSFNFIFIECAALLDCSVFSLYRHLQRLEDTLRRQNILPESSFCPRLRPRGNSFCPQPEAAEGVGDVGHRKRPRYRRQPRGLCLANKPKTNKPKTNKPKTNKPKTNKPKTNKKKKEKKQKTQTKQTNPQTHSLWCCE